MKEDRYIITPCCYKKMLKEFFDAAQKSPNMEKFFASNSDWQLSQFLEWAVWRAPASFMTLCLSSLADDTISMLDCLLNRMDCPVWKNKRHLVTRLYIVLPKEEFSHDNVKQFLARHPQQIVAAWANMNTELFMLKSFYEEPIMNEKEQLLAKEVLPCSITVRGILNQTIDNIYRMGSVTYSQDVYSSFNQMLSPFFRVHEIHRDTSLPLLNYFE